MAAVIRIRMIGNQVMAEITSILCFITPVASVGFSPSMSIDLSADAVRSKDFSSFKPVISVNCNSRELSRSSAVSCY